jgi:DNA-binding transcriptional MerR regulator
MDRDMSASAILRLQASGFSTEQVTALADLVDTQSATKSDLEATENRIDLKLVSIKSDIDSLENRIDLKLAALKSDLEKVDMRLTGELSLLKWMMGFVLAFQVAIFIKLFMR